MFWCVAGFFIVLSVFGAAEVTWGLRGFALCAAATVFVTCAAYFGAAEGWRSLPILARVAIALFVSVCLIQIIPLPPALWTMLPGGEARLAVLTVAGMRDAWMPISLTPVYSVYTALMAFAAALALCGMMMLPQREFRWLSTVLAGIIVAGIAFGVVQVASGGDAFRFYTFTDAGALVGFYANKNHMALAMVCSLPLAWLWSSGFERSRAAPRARVAFIAYAIFAIVMLPLTNSRAGLVLLAAAAIVIGWTAMKAIDRRLRIAGIVAIAALAVAFFAAPLPTALVGRFDEVADDLRWPMLKHSIEVWTHYWAFGSGTGSFANVFMTYEKIDWLFTTYVNNAHNDYVQLAIETGLAGPAALLLLGVSIVIASVRGVRSGDAQNRIVGLTGLAIVLVFAIHSAVDYPLRRPAAVCIFLFGLAAVFRAGREADGNPVFIASRPL